MTSIGANAAPAARILPPDVPTHAYSYPNYSRVKLVSVKDGIYHPSLPSLRKMDMDSVKSVLPDEHNRTSTFTGPEDFRKATTTNFEQPKQLLFSGANLAPFAKNIFKDVDPSEIRLHKDEWDAFLAAKDSGEYRIVLPNYDLKDMHFVGYGVRYLKPEITGSWRYTLVQEPCTDQHGQRPLPATVFSRYRDTFPRYSRNIATEAWRPF